MTTKAPVSSIMTKNLIIADISDDLRHVSTLLKRNHIRHIPVVSGDKLVGIVSKSDILRLSFGDIYEGREQADDTIFDLLKLEQVMVSDPKTVETNDTIRTVAEIFAHEEFHALPVVEGGKIVGIVSTTDIIKYLLEQYE